MAECGILFQILTYKCIIFFLNPTYTVLPYVTPMGRVWGRVA